jgi:hypothetical protein
MAAFSFIFAPPCPRLRGKSSPYSSFTPTPLRPSSSRVPVLSHRYLANDGEPATAGALLQARDFFVEGLPSMGPRPSRAGFGSDARDSSGPGRWGPCRGALFRALFRSFLRRNCFRCREKGAPQCRDWAASAPSDAGACEAGEPPLHRCVSG